VAEQNTIMTTSSLFISRSHLTSEGNKTGSWRFLRPRYRDKTAPCSAACPAGEDIGRIEMLTARGLFKEAWETILQENPFPGVCGRVCYYPCEQVCNRGEFDDAIAIHRLERFLADTAGRYKLDPELLTLPRKQQKIAVVGAGPSGMSAAYFLTRLGYVCDIFESKSEPGGVLRWGIPSYRLPVKSLREEIDQAARVGFTIHCGQHISPSFVSEARARYDAVFLGCGYARTLEMQIPGEYLDGVGDGLSFLAKINKGEITSLSGRIAVIGGGNTAIDVARSVLRLGGKPVLIYRRRRKDMPAFADEIEMALEEGIELLELRAVTRIERNCDEYLLTLQQVEVAYLDAYGRACVEPVPGKAEQLRVSKVFKAIGLAPLEEWYDPPIQAKDSVRLFNTVLTHSDVGPALVYGGDLASSIKSVVHAVASGKEAAIALDLLFQEGMDAIVPRMAECAVGGGPSLSMESYTTGPRCQRSSHIVQFAEINADYFGLSPRIVQPRLLKEERIYSFAEIELKISANLAIREAERCFNCGLCNGCDNCRLFCPDLAVKKDAEHPSRHIDYDYCKGCGICVVECPRNAMMLEEES
jgi:NADPH-dependent glutamate synthase beta subunit-like oxidoreductase